MVRYGAVGQGMVRFGVVWSGTAGEFSCCFIF